MQMPKRRQSALERERSSNSSNARALAILCESSESDHTETNQRLSYSRRRTQRLAAALRKQFQSRGNAALQQSIDDTLTRHGPPCKRPRATSATTELALSCLPHAVRTPKACQVSIIALSNPSSLTEQCVMPLPVVHPQRRSIGTSHGSKQNKRTTTTTTIDHPPPDPHSELERNPHKSTRPNEDDNNDDDDVCDDSFEPLSDAFLSQPPPLPNGQLRSSLCGTAQLVTECLQQRRWNLQYNASIAAVAGSPSSQLNDGVPFDNHYQHQGSPTAVAMQNTATRGAKEMEEEEKEVHSPSVAALGSPFHEGVDHHRTPSAQSTTSKATSMECLSSPLWSATALMRRSTSLMELSRSQRRRSTTSRRLLSEWSVHDREDDDDDGQDDDTAEDADAGGGGGDDFTTTTKVLSSTQKVEGERQQAMLESANGPCEEVRQAIADAASSPSRSNLPPPASTVGTTMMMVSPYKCRERSDIWATILEHCSSSKKKRKAEQQEQQHWETNGGPVGNRVEEVQAAVGTQEGAACRRALFLTEEMGGADNDLDDVPTVTTTSRPCVSTFCRPLTYDDEEGGGREVEEQRELMHHHVSPRLGGELPTHEDYRCRVGDDDDPRGGGGPPSSAYGSFLAPTFAVYLFEGSNNSTQQSQPHTQASSPLLPEGGGGVQSQTSEQDTCPASALMQPTSFFVKDLQSIANECALSCSQMWSQQVWTATELSQHHAEEKEDSHHDDVQHRKTTSGDTPFSSTLLSGDLTADSLPSSAGRHHDDKKRDSLSMRNANLLLDQRISMLLDSVLTH